MTFRTKVGPGSAAAALCDEVDASMQTALKELRTFSYLMHPLALQADGLRLTIRQYLDGYVEHAGLTVKFEVEPEVRRAAVGNARMLFASFRKCRPTSIVMHLYCMSVLNCGGLPVSRT